MLGSYFALTVRLELSQLQGNLGILAACGGRGEGQVSARLSEAALARDCVTAPVGRWHGSSWA